MAEERPEEGAAREGNEATRRRRGRKRGKGRLNGRCSVYQKQHGKPSEGPDFTIHLQKLTPSNGTKEPDIQRVPRVVPCGVSTSFAFSKLADPAQEVIHRGRSEQAEVPAHTQG